MAPHFHSQKSKIEWKKRLKNSKISIYIKIFDEIYGNTLIDKFDAIYWKWFSLHGNQISVVFTIHSLSPMLSKEENN